MKTKNEANLRTTSNKKTYTLYNESLSKTDFATLRGVHKLFYKLWFSDTKIIFCILN